MKNQKFTNEVRKRWLLSFDYFNAVSRMKSATNPADRQSSKSAKKSELLEFQIQECCDILDKYEFSGVYNADSM